MEPSKIVHVVPKSDGWSVRAGHSRSSSYTTQREAIDAARTAAKRAGGELVIHGRDGRIRDTSSYGADPAVSASSGRRSRAAHVVAAEGGWSVRAPNTTKRVHPTRKQAEEEARRLIRSRGGGEVFVHSRDGRIIRADSFGKGAESRIIKDPPASGKLSKSKIKKAVWNGSAALRRYS